MSNVLVVYATKTNHSKKIAEAIAKQVNTEAVNIKINDFVQNADLIFIIGGIYGGKSMPELIEFAKKLNANTVKKAVLATSSVSESGRSQKNLCRILTDNGIEVIEEITCPGSFLFLKRGRPNTKDIDMLMSKTKNILQNEKIFV